MTFSIGDVLDQLSDEFPDITVSKIRFLESQGLINPMRTASGFRMFSESDITKLKWILIHQRDRFLPLKVIKEHLTTMSDDDFADGNMPSFDFESSGALALEGSEDSTRHSEEPSDAGVSHLSAVPEPTNNVTPIFAEKPAEVKQAKSATLLQEAPEKPKVVRKTADTRTHKIVRNLSASSQRDSALAELDSDALIGSTEAMSPKKSKAKKAKLAKEGVLSLETMTIETGISGPVLKELVRFGVIEATGSGNAMVFSSDEIVLASALAPLLERGIEPRHIKTYALFASREAGFLEHVVQDDLRRRNPEAREIAQEKAKQFIQDTARLKEILLLRAIKSDSQNK